MALKHYTPYLSYNFLIIFLININNYQIFITPLFVKDAATCDNNIEFTSLVQNIRSR